MIVVIIPATALVTRAMMDTAHSGPSRIEKTPNSTHMEPTPVAPPMTLRYTIDGRRERFQRDLEWGITVDGFRSVLAEELNCSSGDSCTVEVAVKVGEEKVILSGGGNQMSSYVREGAIFAVKRAYKDGRTEEYDVFSALRELNDDYRDGPAPNLNATLKALERFMEAGGGGPPLLLLQNLRFHIQETLQSGGPSGQQLKRENEELRQQVAKLQLELGEKLLKSDPARAKKLLLACGLPEAEKPLATLNRFEGSNAEKYAAQSLLAGNRDRLKSLGVNVTDPHLLMWDVSGEFTMAEFWWRAGEASPTLVLVEMESGLKSGGVAGVPWPASNTIGHDATKASFVFTLGTKPRRYDLKGTHALWAIDEDGDSRFQFGHVYSMAIRPGEVVPAGRNERQGVHTAVHSAGVCAAQQGGPYDIPSGDVTGASDRKEMPYARWELWRL
jgi:hypothetical protein